MKLPVIRTRYLKNLKNENVKLVVNDRKCNKSYIKAKLAPKFLFMFLE